VDAMSDAIEGADVMLYGVSVACKSFALVCHLSKSPQINSGLCVYFATDKESANVSALSNLRASDNLPVCCLPCICSNAVAVPCISQCRMEANYAHQQELDMIPLMMQKGYAPKGYVHN
jgi:hypothetical protein